MRIVHPLKAIIAQRPIT